MFPHTYITFRNMLFCFWLVISHWTKVWRPEPTGNLTLFLKTMPIMKTMEVTNCITYNSIVVYSQNHKHNNTTPTKKSESPWLKLMSHWFVRITKHLKDHVSHHDSLQMSLITLRLTKSESSWLARIFSDESYDSVYVTWMGH